MDIFLAIVAILLTLVGIAGCIIPALPGTLLSYAGLLCSYFTAHSTISQTWIWIWLLVAIAVSTADFYLPAWVTRRMGGSRAGAIGATVGMVGGFFFFPPIGIILGPFAGAVLGELIDDKSDVNKAFKVGLGSFLSFAVGTGLKLVVSMAIFGHVVADTYPPVRDWVVSIF